MNFQQLKNFQVVAELEHISRAAKHLNISQPALSNSIRRLEESLEVKLFDRIGKQIKLNSFGKIYLNTVNETFLNLDKGMMQLKDLSGEEGMISFAMSMPYVFPELVGNFMKIYPNVHFRQERVKSAAEIKIALEDSKLDFCISTTKITGPNIEWLAINEQEMRLSVPKHHKFAKRDSINLIEAKNEPFISTSTEYNYREFTDEFCWQANFKPNIVLEIEETSALQSLVAMGFGVSFILPCTLGNTDNGLDNVHVKISDPVCKIELGIAWNRDHYFSSAALNFKEYILKYFEELT